MASVFDLTLGVKALLILSELSDSMKAFLADLIAFKFSSTVLDKLSDDKAVILSAITDGKLGFRPNTRILEL